MSCYIEPIPGGVNEPLERDVQNAIVRAFSGEDVAIRTTPQLADGTAATEDNSVLRFTLSQNRFHFTPIWEGTWSDGIEQVDGTDLVEIRPSAEILDQLRRGGYRFSLAVSDLDGDNRRVVLTGNLLIEYEPTSPQHDIPYRTQEDET